VLLKSDGRNAPTNTGRVDTQQCIASSSSQQNSVDMTAAVGCGRHGNKVGHSAHGLPRRQPALPGNLLDLVGGVVDSANMTATVGQVSSQGATRLFRCAP
jgi:hypothetical protein